MGLDFTSIEDKHGAAVCLLHDGTTANKHKMESLAESIKRHSDKQILVIAANEEDGRKIIDFYDIQTPNAALIVRDDDQLFQFWLENEIPTADQIAYSVNRVG